MANDVGDSREGDKGEGGGEKDDQLTLAHSCHPVTSHYLHGFVDHAFAAQEFVDHALHVDLY